MTTFSKGDRVCRYGKPSLGIGVVEGVGAAGEPSKLLRVRWHVDGNGYVGFHSKSHLRREKYQARNVERGGLTAEMFVQVHDDGEPMRRGEEPKP